MSSTSEGVSNNPYSASEILDNVIKLYFGGKVTYGFFIFNFGQYLMCMRTLSLVPAAAAAEYRLVFRHVHDFTPSA